MKISKTTILGLITAVLAILAGWKPEIFSDEVNAALLDIVDKGWIFVSLVLSVIAMIGAKDAPLKEALKNLGQ